MTVRIEVQPDGSVEIMRPRGEHSQFLSYASIDSAMHVIRFFIKQDIKKAAKDRFIPQLHKEAQKAFKSLEEKSPYGQKG